MANIHDWVLLRKRESVEVKLRTFRAAKPTPSPPGGAQGENREMGNGVTNYTVLVDEIPVDDESGDLQAAVIFQRLRWNSGLGVETGSLSTAIALKSAAG